MVSLFPHPASFRFRLTTDTLAFGYLLPATGRIRVFHPLDTCAAGRTQNQPQDSSLRLNRDDTIPNSRCKQIAQVNAGNIAILKIPVNNHQQ